MEAQGNNERREEIFSEVVRAGKRTYFFDVKETRGLEKYLTITESKRRFNNESGKFYYEKHKLFLYKEDFEKFSNGLKSVIDFIQSSFVPEPEVKTEEAVTEEKPPVAEIPDVSFEDLDKEEPKTEE